MSAHTDRDALTDEFVASFAASWQGAWNSGDPAEVAELCAEDVYWADPALPEPQVGRAAVLDFARRTFATFPDFCIEETAPPLHSTESPRALAPYRIRATMRGPFDPFAATYAPVVIEGVDEWTFRNDELAAYNTYYDSLGLARQVGVLPSTGSLAERGLAWLQHQQARIQRAKARRSAPGTAR